jgi:hypothetical protein
MKAGWTKTTVIKAVNLLKLFGRYMNLITPALP